MSMLQSVGDFELLAAVKSIARSLKDLSEKADEIINAGESAVNATGRKRRIFVLFCSEFNQFVSDVEDGEVKDYAVGLYNAFEFSSYEEADNVAKDAQYPLSVLEWR